MKAFKFDCCPSGPQGHVKRQQVFITGMGAHGFRGQSAVIQQAGEVVALKASRQPFGEFPDIGRGLAATPGLLIVPQVMGDAA